MKNRTTIYKREKGYREAPFTIIIALLSVFIWSDISYAYWQDPRVPAANHPLSDSLAPAIGRLEASCTAWITKGGILITAGHCDPSPGDKVEFNVPSSDSDGAINNSSEEDTYIISQVISSNDNTPTDDWAIFRVNNNSLTGLQPIEAQQVYIELVRDLTGDTYRTIGYGRSNIPWEDYDHRNKTLQTHSGDNLTQNVTGYLVECSVFNTPGGSGSPIIDESTGHAVGVQVNYRTGDEVTEGTSAYRSSFWNAYQAEQNNFTLSVTQKTSSGQTLTGSSIGRWDGSNFTNHTLTGSSVNFSAWEGNIEILRGDQNIYNNPKEKYNEWVGFSDIRNHRVFLLESQTDQYISQFEKTYSDITVTTAFSEYPSVNGSGSIQFKDPWLIDYNDPDFDDSPRNRGMDAVFYSHSAPFTPGFNTINGKLYNGLFSGENPNFLPNLPNYSVRANSQTINLGGSLGSRQAVFAGWEGDDVDFKDANDAETGVVFNDSGAEARAKMKIRGLSNDSKAFASNSQRRLVQTTSGSMPGHEYWLHRVYTSMGHVWMEYSSDRGATWTLGNGGKPLDGGAGGKNPSMDYYHDDWDNMNYIGVVWQQPYNNTYTIEGMMFNQSAMSVQNPQSLYATTIYTEPSDAYSVDANPSVVLTGGANSLYVVSIERKSNSGNWAAGINLLVGTIDDIGTNWAGPFNSSETHAKIAQTNANTMNVQMSLVPGSQNALNLIRQQGTSGPIYNELISVSRSSGGLITINQAPDGVISYPSLSTKPSLVSFSDYYFSACWIEAYDMVYFNLATPSVLYYFGDFANSCSINRGGGAGTNGFAVWSQNPYSGRSNKSIRFTNGLPESSTITTLTTSGQYVQAGNGTTSNLSHMYVTAFYPFTAPYHFKTSSALGPVAKERAAEIVESRGFFLNLGETVFRYQFGGLKVDGEQIPFVEASDKEDYGNLETLNSVLLTEPFQVRAGSEIAFNEWVGFADSSTSAAKAMGTDAHIRYKLELIDEATGRAAGLLREGDFTSSNLQSIHSRDYKVNPSGLKDKWVRAKITVETNLVKKQEPVAIPDAFPEELRSRRFNSRSTNLKFTRHYSEVNETSLKQDAAEITVLNDVPESYNLAQNYPNPFNPSTVLRYQLPENNMVRLEVFDLLGRKVSILVNERQSAGHYSVTFDASHLASGFYIYRLQAGNFIQSKKLFLVK